MSLGFEMKNIDGGNPAEFLILRKGHKYATPMVDLTPEAIQDLVRELVKAHNHSATPRYNSAGDFVNSQGYDKEKEAFRQFKKYMEERSSNA